jgi:ribosomal protein L32
MKCAYGRRAMLTGVIVRRRTLRDRALRLPLRGAPLTEQNVNVTQVVQNQGCMSGCFTLFAVLAVIGLAVEYWYVSVGVLVVAALAGWLYWRQQQELQPASETEARGVPASASAPTPVSVGAATGKTCANCGTMGIGGKFCPECGAPQTKTCAGCGQVGLATPFCPNCGSATYWPPTPT